MNGRSGRTLETGLDGLGDPRLVVIATNKRRQSVARNVGAAGPGVPGPAGARDSRGLSPVAASYVSTTLDPLLASKWQ